MNITTRRTRRTLARCLTAVTAPPWPSVRRAARRQWRWIGATDRTGSRASATS